ncbi:MAG TPA: hypothetical protein VKA27_06185 [Sunxiuqinia sp.]|nr:hypothetical protein [Sunxiuqinia sp.]
METTFPKLKFGELVQDCYFMEIDIPEDYIKAQEELPLLQKTS